MAETGKIAKTIRRLRTLERDWPAGYILFANGSGGNIILCEGHPEDGGRAVDTFQIPADGGDPDWVTGSDSDRRKRLRKFAPPSSAITQTRITRPSFTDDPEQQP